MAERETVERLYAAIRQLPKTDAALVLLYLDDMSYRQIAEVLHAIGEPSQGRQLGQVFQHPLHVVALLFGEVFLTLHDQKPMLENKVRFLLDRHPATGCCCLGFATLAAPRLLPSTVASPAECH